MPEFRFEIQGLDELKRNLIRYPQISAPLLARAINMSLAEMHKVTGDDSIFQFKTARAYRTGFLAQKLAINPATPSSLKGSIGPTVKYAIFVHEGTAPHRIEPKNKPFLAWKGAGWSGGYVTSKKGNRYYKSVKGDWIFTKKGVNHPGTAANPFMKRIMAAAQPEIDKHFENVLNEITKEIAK
jgi:hypothetical protein